MFGLFRVFLTLMVFAGHLLMLGNLGQFAVFGFYVLSGYLMTTVMRQNYGYSWDGFFRYSLNRFLRIFPSWWFAFALSVVIIFFIGSNSKDMHSAMLIPKGFNEWLKNIFLFFPTWFPVHSRPRVSPSTWALTVELFFYILIGLGISKTKRRTWLWALVSTVNIPLTFIIGLGFEHRYFPIAAASLPFSLGSMITYYQMPELKTKNWWAAVLLILLPINWLLFVKVGVSKLDQLWMREVGFYVNLVICICSIYLLNDKRSFTASLRKWDNLIGSWTYPIYILHWPVALAVSVLLFSKPIKGLSFNSLISAACTLVICIILSEFIRRAIDNPIQKLRKQIKKNSHPVPHAQGLEESLVRGGKSKL